MQLFQLSELCCDLNIHCVNVIHTLFLLASKTYVLQWLVINWMTWGLILGKDSNFSCRHQVQTSSGTHPVSCLSLFSIWNVFLPTSLHLVLILRMCGVICCTVFTVWCLNKLKLLSRSVQLKEARTFLDMPVILSLLKRAVPRRLHNEYGPSWKHQYFCFYSFSYVVLWWNGFYDGLI